MRQDRGSAGHAELLWVLGREVLVKRRGAVFVSGERIRGGGSGFKVGVGGHGSGGFQAVLCSCRHDPLDDDSRT